MAAAVSSMENGMSSSSRSTQQQQQQQQPQPHHQRRHTARPPGFRQSAPGRPIRPRLSSSRSSSSSSRLSSRASSRAPSPFRSGSSLIPSAARIGGSGPSSLSASGSSSRGAAGGLWASIMWLGAAALPASLAPPASAAAAVGASPSSSSSTSSPPGRHGGGGARRGTTAAARTRNFSSSSSSSSLSQSSPSSLPEATVSTPRSAPEHPGVAVAGGARADPSGEVRLLLPPPPSMPIGGRGVGLRAEAGDGRSASVAGERGAEEEEEEEEAADAAPVSGSGVGKARSPEKHVYLEGGTAIYTCSMCRAHLATRDHVVSECFHGHGGRAFLFERCVNVSAGRPEDRLLMTGMHVVADISCKRCGAELGWKYEEAAEKSQKYKEGKFILERCAVALEGRGGDGFHGPSSQSTGRYSAERCGSRSIIGWGADTSDSSARW